MKAHVDCVVAPGLEAGYEVVKAKTDNADWSVGAMRVARVDGCAPEVVFPNARQWSRRQDICIAEYGTTATEIQYDAFKIRLMNRQK